MKIRLKYLCATSLIAISCQAANALAQQANSPPVRQAVDERSVDLLSGDLRISLVPASIGSGDSKLEYQLYWQSGAFISNYDINMDHNYLVSAPPQSESFLLSNGVFSNRQGGKSRLVQTNPTAFTYYTNSGVQIKFFKSGDYYAYQDYHDYLPASIIDKDGAQLTYGYANAYQGSRNITRVSEINSTNGYSVRYSYARDANPVTDADLALWRKRVKVTLYNRSVDNCINLVGACSFSGAWPSVTLTDSGSSYSVVGAPSDSVTLSSDSGNFYGLTRTVTMRKPGDTQDRAVVRYANGRVDSYTDISGTWNYRYSYTPSEATTTITNPAGSNRYVVFDNSKRVPVREADETGRLTTYTNDALGRVTNTLHPAGNQTSVTYDANGSVIERREISKTPGTPPDIVSSASYDTYIYSPSYGSIIWEKDAAGAQTDYAYDPTYGQLTSVTSPANSAGVRPQKRITRTPLQAYFKSSSGAIVAGGTRRVVTGISQCITGASCIGTAQEARLTIGYGPQSAGTANNLLPVTQTRSAGDGSLTSTSTVGYDPVGNVASVDGPLAGTADTTRFGFDTDRQLITSMSPDPDGAGVLKPRAVRNAYTSRGELASVEIGNVPSGATDWSGFAAAQVLQSTYDAGGRKTKDTLVAGAATQSVMQYGYGAVGRLICRAQRMDPSVWTQQSDSCVPQTTGPNGPDRVQQLTYDEAGRVKMVTEAVGTTAASSTQTSYNLNGQVETVTDGNLNVTTYGFDGFSRQTRTTFPGGSFEELTLSAVGNATSRRLRDGQSVGYTYDALGRMTAKDRPNATYWEADQSYAYNNLGNLISASDSNGHSLAFSYDALDRQTGASDNWYTFGNSTFLYDAADRRTQTTWGDGNYFIYDYLATGEAKTVKDWAGNLLVTFGYNDLGRRSSISRANGTVTTYGYDPLSRLWQLTHDLAGASSDLTVGLTYNPASQITTRTSTNDAYAWTGSYNVDRAYQNNALNQVTASGADQIGYDGRGNLTSSNGMAYTYTTDNQLAAVGVIGLAYDPLGRLFNINSEQGTNITFSYDGPSMVAETNQATGGLLRRYIYVPGSDEPLIWYEGSGFGDRRWFHADERGTIVSVSNDAGNTVGINAYDEFGIPASTNISRFQFTGQKWLPSIGLYDFKARVYSPTLGRFMQTDPIGYADGMNLYNYVGSDPINATDPSGTEGEALLPAPLPDGLDILVNGKLPGLSNLSNDAIGSGSFSLWTSFWKSEAAPPAPQNDDIVVVARRTTRLPNVLPRTLWNHFLDGSGDTVCLNRSQFGDLASAGKRVGSLAPRAGGGYAQQTSYYGGDYANSFGTATLYLDGERNATGFHDFYNFDAHGRTSVSAQAKTAIGALGYLAGGKDFSVDYNNGDCR